MTRGRTFAGLFIFFLLLLLSGRPGFAAVSCGAPNSTGASICSVDPAFDPAALCNDGTLPVFWIRPGHDAGANTWVIWLEGGGNCTDILSCTARTYSSSAKNLSSNGFTMAVGVGVLAAEPSVSPVLYNANVVFAHYCSSDDWSGDYASGAAFLRNDPTTWNFEGRRIAAAVVASVGELNPGLAAARMILLGGSSAGALGITYNANDILPSLPPGADIRLVNDAGFSLDIGQYDPTAPAPYMYAGHPNAFETSFQNGMALWHGHGDSVCDAAATTQQAHVDCFNTSMLLQRGTIPLPTFVAESQIDQVQELDELCPQFYGFCQLPPSPSQMRGQYAVAFGTAMMAALTGAGTSAAYTVASPDAYMHVLLGSTLGFVAKFLLPDGAAPRDAFDAWVSAPPGPRVIQFGTSPGVSGFKFPS